MFECHNRIDEATIFDEGASHSLGISHPMDSSVISC